MSTSTFLDTLKINYLTQAQYDAALQAGTINADELYLTPPPDTLAGYGITDAYINGTDITLGINTLTVSDTNVTNTAVTAASTYYLTGSSSSSTTTGTLNKHAAIKAYVTANSGTGGSARIDLGNTTATTSSGGKEGILRLYGTGATYYTDLKAGAVASSNKTITFPDATGTVALTSDIPTVPTNVSAFTNDAGYLTSAPVSDITLNGSSIVSGGIADITDSSGNLTLDGSLTTGSFINLPNDISLRGYTSTGGTLNIGNVSPSNNVVLGNYSSYTTSGNNNDTNVYGNNINLNARTNITLNLSTSEALYTAINTAGWTSAVIV